MPMTDYLANQLRRHMFGTASFAKLTTVYVALFTASPTAAGGGTEVVGGAYGRVAVTVVDASWNFPATPSGEANNLSTITFPAPTANWGDIVSQGLYDAASGGNLLTYGLLATPRTVNSGDPAPSFGATTLKQIFRV